MNMITVETLANTDALNLFSVQEAPDAGDRDYVAEQIDGGRLCC